MTKMGNLVTNQLDELIQVAAGAPNSEGANGRTIGKTDLYVGAIKPASATVDKKDAAMTEDNAKVLLTVNNTNGFYYHRPAVRDCIWSQSLAWLQWQAAVTLLPVKENSTSISRRNDTKMEKKGGRNPADPWWDWLGRLSMDQ